MPYTRKPTLSPEINPQWFPTYKSGNYYFCNSPASNSTSITLGNSTLRLSPWVITKPLLITKIGAEFTVAGDAASLFRIGVYADDGLGLPVGNPVLDPGSISTGTGNAGTVATGGTPGVYEITVSQLFQPGVYWAGGAVQGAAGTQPTMRITAAQSHIAPLPSAALPLAGAGYTGFQLNAVAGALPAWSGASLMNSCARLFFKVA